MPMYTWKIEELDMEIDVLRSINDYDNPPTHDECIEKFGPDAPTYGWIRTIGAPRITKGMNWGSGKGNWGR